MSTLDNLENQLKLQKLARNEFISQLLCEIATDLQVCRLINEFFDNAEKPLIQWKEYLEMIKTEVDRYYERVSNSKT